jgi:hypothetical protein
MPTALPDSRHGAGLRAVTVFLQASTAAWASLQSALGALFWNWHNGCFKCLSWISTRFHAELDSRRPNMDSLIHMVPVVSAIGYSLVYLLAGGGVFGAFVIFVIAKMLGQ